VLISSFYPGIYQNVSNLLYLKWFDVGFYPKGNNRITYSIEIKEETVRACDSYGEEEICVEAFGGET
jgi:hypothetical protein